MVAAKYWRMSLLACALAGAFALAACGGDDASSTSGSAASSSVAASSSSSALPKNVIVMISDGASAGTWDMAAYWQAGVKVNQLPVYSDLPVRLGMTTYPLNTSTSPTNNASAMVSYDAAQAWDTTVGTADTDSYATAIAGYKYLKKNYTDSAAAGTALASGQKTYNNAINYDNFGQPLEYITQIAKTQGKATGVVTSVQLSHATPATFAAQNSSRNNMTAIAAMMLTSGYVDLLMGTGHPEYDSNGVTVTGLSSTDCEAKSECKNPYNTIGSAEWAALKAGTLKPTGATSPWTLLENKSAFEALAAGNLSVSGPVVGIPKVRSTLQQARADALLGADSSQPSGVKMIATVPDLATMTTGALNHLGKNQKGLFLMVEGGAVDWAAHANQTGRMIEEQVDFDRAVAAVKAWVEKNSNWNETLLIITTDHGNALPLSANSDTKAFEQVTNNGAGKLPGVRYWTGNHTNEVVRLWARGKGSDKFAAQLKSKDAKFAEIIGHNTDGSYVDNTDVFKVVKANLGK